MYNFDTKEILPKLTQLVEQLDIDKFIVTLVDYIHSLVKQPTVIGKYIYLEEVDHLLVQLSERIKQNINLSPVTLGNEKTNAGLILATEIYSSGGHSNVIKDIVNIYPNTNIILTDLFGRYQKGLWTNFTNLVDVSTAIFILPSEKPSKKLLRLISIINSYSGPIFLFNHQDDVLIILASLLANNKNIYFIHHADHTPSLGCTIKKFKHTDLFKHMSDKCKLALNHDVHLLPLSVKDLGLKSISQTDILNTVTSGSFNKFSKSGNLDYKNLVATILNTINGKHYHIGKIDDQFLIDLKNHLQAKGLDINRFLYIEHVPSLWEALKSIDAHIYICSCPTGGWRAEIEAQGCGYPIISFTDNERPLLEFGPHNPSTTYFKSLDELPSSLIKASKHIAEMSEKSREYYLNNFDFINMKSSIDKIFTEK